MGKPWFFAKINMKRKIRNTIIAFTLMTSILCGNLFVSPVYAEEIENTADNVETLTLAEEETKLQEEITEAENPDVDTIEEQKNTDESVDEIEEDEKTDETDEIDETDETEKTDAVEDIPKESIIPEEIPSATETPVPTPEIEIKEDEEQIISVVKSDIDSDVYADAVAMVEEKYTGKTLADAFELSVSENTEFPVTITFSANIKADDNALLFQYTGSEWTEIVIDAVEDGSITATFDFLGSIIVLKDEIEEVIEDVEEDQITEETLPLSYEKSIDNIEVSVTADAGVFPSGSTVLINKVNVSENIFTEENIQETYSFDITVVCNGEEVQPDTSKGNVTVSFAQIEIASDATVDVYHVTENLQATSEKIQNVEVNNDNVSFQVEHFSVYTVIIATTDNSSKPYYLNEAYALNEQIPLTEILNAAGVDYSEYMYINTSSYSVNIEGQEYGTSTSSYTYLYGTIEESYMIFKKEGNYWINIYLYKNDKSTKKTIKLYMNIQNTTTHDFQLGDNVFADFNEDTGHLSIIGTGDMWNTSDIFGNYFIAITPIKEKIHSVSIGDGVTSIRSKLFMNCKNISGSLVIPNTVTKIENHAFYNCGGFTGNLVIPDSVISIGKNAFQNCSGFDGTLTLSTKLTTIGESAFQGCSGLTGNLIIPDSVTSLKNSVFVDCSGFNGSLKISTNITQISDYTFKNCSNLTGDLIIPDTVTRIGNWAFQNCSGFDGTLTLSTKLTTIGQSAFYGCSGFAGRLVIPSGMTTINIYTFLGCDLINDITIPNSVTKIYSDAFKTSKKVRTRLTTENSVALNYNWAGSNRKIISDVTITYHSNNADRGSVPVDSTVYETDDTIIVLDNTGMLEKDGLIFLGWNTASDGSGTLYKKGQTITAEQSNIDLYAQFGNQPEEYTIKLPLELNMTVVNNQFKGTADITVDYYMETKKVNISVADFYMTDNTGDKISVTGSVTGNGWHNGNTDATYNDADGMYHGTSHVALTAPAKAGNYTGNLVFTITEENIGG